MKLLVTGGLGFIGGVTSRLAVDRGHEVLVVDDGRGALVEPSMPFHSRKSVEDPSLADEIGEFDPDAVLHLAGSSSVAEGEGDPLGYLNNNVSAFSDFLGTLLRSGSRPAIVFSSSCAIYGNTDTFPIKEDQRPAPVSWYGWTKLMAERLLEAFCRKYGFAWTSLRFFNVIGAAYGISEIRRVRDRLVPKLLEAASGEDPSIVVYGGNYPTKDGTCVRDYIHVLDIAEAHLAAAGKLMSGALAGTEINLGSGVGASVLDVIEATERITEKKFRRLVREGRKGDAVIAVSSFEWARKSIGWEPRRSLEDGIRDVWNLMRHL